MLHFNEGTWGSIMSAMWYFPCVSLEHGLIAHSGRKAIRHNIIPEISRALQDNLVAYK
jgi:hypothetical protein